ncbi:MAG: molybdopterin-binding oxidoreductase, partial [Acidobacteriota bacterium]
MIGALLTAPLIAVFFIGWRLVGLPFIPFHLFDWTARILPGRVITFGIDSMVKVIRRLGIADTASAAKAAEQAMAIAVFLVAGVLAAAVLFSVLRAVRTRRPVLTGTVLGALASVASVLVTGSLGRTSSIPATIGGLWIISAFVAWGAALGWA